MMFVSPYPKIYSIHLGCAGQIHGACNKHLSKLTWIQKDSAGPRVEFRLFFSGKSRSYQDYNPTTFLTNAVSPINCESKLWWEKLIVKHLFGEPSFSANNNVWFVQFHKTKEMQLFLPKGLDVYMEYFQGRGRGCAQGRIQPGCTGCTCTPLVSEYMFIVCSMLEAPWIFRQQNQGGTHWMQGASWM